MIILYQLQFLLQWLLILRGFKQFPDLLRFQKLRHYLLKPIQCLLQLQFQKLMLVEYLLL
jgi:hypothetical protein